MRNFGDEERANWAKEVYALKAENERLKVEVASKKLDIDALCCARGDPDLLRDAQAERDALRAKVERLKGNHPRYHNGAWHWGGQRLVEEVVVLEINAERDDLEKEVEQTHNQLLQAQADAAAMRAALQQALLNESYNTNVEVEQINAALSSGAGRPFLEATEKAREALEIFSNCPTSECRNGDICRQCRVSLMAALAALKEVLP